MDYINRNNSFRDLGRVLRPNSIAVIGASEQPGNLGGIAVSLMKKFGFKGEIWPVNPKEIPVHGLKCFGNVSDLPEPADLAIIGTGANLTAGIVSDCAVVGIRNGIVWAGGYSEVGKEGAALQASLLEVCQKTDFTLVGPNCIGVINSRSAMVASFASFLVEADRLVPGNIAMISQSGGLATMAQAFAQRRGMGFNLTVSTGNEAMLSVGDYIHAVAGDEDTKVIAAYIEGVRDGPRFIEAVSAARAAGKPVVVLKSGLTEAGAQAAAAHTGALVGAGRVWEAIARELGIITVGSLEELLDVSLYLSRLDLTRMPRGNRVAIVSFGGGSGVLAADQCAANGLVLPALHPETVTKLAPLLPPIASTQNPVDVTPLTFNQEKWFATFPEAMETIAADPGIDILYCQFGPQAQRGVETAKIVSALREHTAKTVCLAWPLPPPGATELLDSEGMYVFQEFERAIKALAKLADNMPAPRSGPSPNRGAAPDWASLVPDATAGLVVSEDECHRLLSQMGVAVARGALARTEDAVAEVAREIGFPVAAKGISAAITHRAAAGLVFLDLRTEADLRAAFRGLVARASAGGAVLDGVYVQRMIPKGIEIIVSAFRDPVFGTMVSCGWGGNLTEIVDDVATARAPLDVASAQALLKRLKIVNGAPKLDSQADIADLARFVAHFSEVAKAVPWKSFVIELNPVKWSAGQAIAVDGLLIVQEP
jgi:acetyltransferase